MKIRKLAQALAAGGLATLMVSTQADWTQAQFPQQPGGFGGGPPGGFGGGRGGPGGGRGMNPDDSFNQLSGGKDSFNVNTMPPDQKASFMRRAGFMGIQVPPDGTITRDYYKKSAETAMERFRSMRGAGGPPGSPGGFGGPPGGMTPPTTPTPGAPPTFGGPPSGGRGGFDPNSMTDAQIKEQMRRYDRDGDGRISLAEVQGNDRARNLIAGWSNYDKNGDGFIDSNEYKFYLIDRVSGRFDNNQTPGTMNASMSQNPQFGQPGQQYPGNQPYPSNFPNNLPPGVPGILPEEPRPVVYRFGKLPVKDLPSFFVDLDTDKDGQIGLYEWRKGGKDIEEFLAMDLNSDGFVTAEEYLKIYKPAVLQQPSLTASMNGPAGAPGVPGGPPAATNGSDANSNASATNGDRSRGSDKSDKGSQDRGDRGSRSKGDKGDKGSRSRGGDSGGANPFNSRQK